MVLVLSALASVSCASRRRGAEVVTQHDDPARTGVTDAEPRLSPDLLARGLFGRLYDRRVDGGDRGAAAVRQGRADGNARPA